MNKENSDKIENAVHNIIEAIGDDPNRQSIQETPARVASAYAEIFSETGKKHFHDYKIFNVAENAGMVLVQDIPFYSMCEHHLLPFFGTVNVAYVPQNGKIIGLSKIPRLVDFAAHRPSVQENITVLIANELQRILNPKGIAVSISARHMCMEMRGINKSGLFTYTNKFLGQFSTDQELKNEFLQQTHQR
ncbi:GTP cyclohydrolase I FolE [Pediococcus cellicola]|uniref:GTP cyclohydrolase 1 n=1 Tax=Pediococcus cellicola TaxID=319652 RepID=A0A0R2ISX3_9LACO|nr:GTP cyclohydrolase I FolE [Pediococcus cellicola]KRN65925.1 GTP cyclohydrolase I [Pediococcus cellicola]GEL16001.1 GTP cyclohydrolase 1 [Pediococcus cellicola]